MKKSDSVTPVIDIEHIARLAKLKLTDAEIEKFAGELTPVLKYVDQLKELSTNDVGPLITASDIEYWMREDKVQRVSTAEEAVSNAPERAGNLFKVPPVV